MKNTNKLILAVAVAAFSLTAANQAKADGALLSPRAEASKSKVVARDPQSDPDLVRNQPMGLEAKVAAQKVTLRAKSSATEPNLVRRPFYTGKTFLAGPEPQFQIAPVK